MALGGSTLRSDVSGRLDIGLYERSDCRAFYEATEAF